MRMKHQHWQLCLCFRRSWLVGKWLGTSWTGERLYWNENLYQITVSLFDSKNRIMFKWTDTCSVPFLLGQIQYVISITSKVHPHYCFPSVSVSLAVRWKFYRETFRALGNQRDLGITAGNSKAPILGFGFAEILATSSEGGLPRCKIWARLVVYSCFHVVYKQQWRWRMLSQGARLQVTRLRFE